MTQIAMGSVDVLKVCGAAILFMVCRLGACSRSNRPAPVQLRRRAFARVLAILRVARGYTVNQKAEKVRSVYIWLRKRDSHT